VEHLASLTKSLPLHTAFEIRALPVFRHVGLESESD